METVQSLVFTGFVALYGDKLGDNVRKKETVQSLVFTGVVALQGDNYNNYIKNKYNNKYICFCSHKPKEIKINQPTSDQPKWPTYWQVTNAVFSRDRGQYDFRKWPTKMTTIYNILYIKYN